ncbi:Hypothetical_protein [Hexamita inflata]|uniref:Hypothetical_protein n=1 Tax=Hexamita inflata TaxID=28002 RepID=A0AA86PY52_9EUKA|nr:Hypothetical protein HINF_LOCUS33927 [Hexamita inflata]
MIRQLVELYSCRNKFPVGSSGASGVAASATKFFEVTISASISIMQEEIEANLRTGPLLFTRCKTWNVQYTKPEKYNAASILPFISYNYKNELQEYDQKSLSSTVL